jgi:hypothetical protein
MKWIVDIEGRQCVVESKSSFSGAGEVSVDGKVAKAWGSSFMSYPKEITFEIEGKQALLRRRGLLFEKLDLIFDGKVIKRL